MTNPAESRYRESKARFWLTFVLHQFIGVLGIIMSAGIVTGLAFDLLLLFHKSYTRTYFYWILTGRPYFPIQIGLSLLLGWVFSRHLWHRSMVWVWVLPFANLLYAFIAIPTLTPNSLPAEFQAGVGESRLSHYFGWGCGQWNRCIDQVALTLPFYVSVGYSVAALLARKLLRTSYSVNKTECGAYFVVGIWFFVAAWCDLYFSARSGWHWMFLPMMAVPAGIGAYLMLLPFAPRQTDASNALEISSLR